MAGFIINLLEDQSNKPSGYAIKGSGKTLTNAQLEAHLKERNISLRVFNQGIMSGDYGAWCDMLDDCNLCSIMF